MKENEGARGGEGRLEKAKQRDFYSIPDPNLDLSLHNTGEQVCPPGHWWGGLRRSFLIHHVLSGRGTFEWRGRTYTLSTGDGFLVCPGERHQYRADAHDPWHYVWIDFVGRRAGETLAWAGLSPDNPVYRDAPGSSIPPLFRELQAALSRHGPERTMVADAILHRFLATLIQAFPRPPAGPTARSGHYVERAKAFIMDHYASEISIAGLADLVGIHRAHLAEVFLKETGQTVRDYLLSTRIVQACRLLETTDLAITEISNSVGYQVYTAFSIRFKALTGETPGGYRARRRSAKPGQAWLGPRAAAREP